MDMDFIKAESNNSIPAKRKFQVKQQHPVVGFSEEKLINGCL